MTNINAPSQTLNDLDGASAANNPQTDPNLSHGTSKHASSNSNAPNTQAHDPFANLTPTEVPAAIARKVTSLSPELLQQIIHQVQTLCVNSPEQAHAMLTHYPHLAYALLQALLVTESISSPEAIVILYSALFYTDLCRWHCGPTDLDVRSSSKGQRTGPDL